MLQQCLSSGAVREVLAWFEVMERAGRERLGIAPPRSWVERFGVHARDRWQEAALLQAERARVVCEELRLLVGL